ncbi:uncharacterized protein N7484_000481 [Penicillium longicatenatum]|uniref:uncharacterized protein n=1 Tax=Penicillium longicatenatum TaxID=1561947 RepID=UPI0025476842|nr:uncharacterized protein N7484_000481 [Penicillium longicatenatum]KAJ5661109.1 hypothetical protein N7484_000481 [Penicillium longicatenatum]
MATAADAIVLSSSPDPPMRTPKNPLSETEMLFEISPLDQTSLPVPSLADVFRPPSRSRFFPDPSVTDKPAKAKRQPAKKSDTTGPDAPKAPAKSRQMAKRATKEQNPESAALEDLETGDLESRDNTVKKAAPPKKAGVRTTKKAKESGNLKLAGKVTKASSEPKAKKASKASEKSNSKPTTRDIEVGQTNALDGNDNLQLHEAMARRRDWTPPKESAREPVPAVDEEAERCKAGGFGKLLTDYNYSGVTLDSRDAPMNIDGGGPTKRRRIELVDPGVQALISGNSEQSDSSSDAKSKKKPKAQKRFTTLTARMTAQYTTNETPDDDLMEDVVPDITKAKSRRKAKPTNEEPTFTVLSPEAAVKALDAQDLVFGTCSQLEREDSPQTLRDIQQAIRESESLASPASGWSPGNETPRRLGARLTGTRNLWGVAARDLNGSLVQAANLDSIDLTDVSQTSQEKQGKSTGLSAVLDDDWFDLDYGRRAPKSITTLQQKLSEPVVDTTQLPVTEMSSAEVPATKPATNVPVKKVPATKVAPPAAKESSVAKNSRQADIQPPSMPHYPGFTDAELSKQVAMFGFKSIKGRKKMIDLLQKCWESKHGTSSKLIEATTEAQSAPSETTVKSARPKPKSKAKSKPSAASIPESIDKPTQAKSHALTSPKKTPKKTTGTGTPRSSYIDVDEIQDSEEELFLSPIRVQHRSTEISPTKPTQKHTLDIVTKEAPQSPTKRKTTSKTSRSKVTASSVSTLKNSKAKLSVRRSLPDISAQITKAVRSQATLSPLYSSTGSRSRPTWHEKILMYDPIVLEDLTTWLNVEGLGLIDEDREVSSMDVRKWCESNGICCCWKQNASW